MTANDQYLGNDMDNRQTQNKKATLHSSSETYQKKKRKQKPRKSLAKRRKTAIALSVISIGILASIGYEVVTNLDDQKIYSAPQQTKAPSLRILNEEKLENSVYIPEKRLLSNGLDEEVSIFQQLTKQRKLQAQKIKDLEAELKEAKARILQLKTDILIKGSKKEKYYAEELKVLQEKLATSETTNTHLKTEIAARDKVIAGKRKEIESLSQLFTETHSKLENQLHSRETQIEEERSKSEALFAELKEELHLTEQEMQQSDAIREALAATIKRVAELEEVVEETTRLAEQESQRSEALSRNLLIAQSELEKAEEETRNTINGNVLALAEQLEEYKKQLRPNSTKDGKHASSYSYQQQLLISDLQKNLASLEKENEEMNKEILKLERDLYSFNQNKNPQEESIGEPSEKIHELELALASAKQQIAEQRYGSTSNPVEKGLVEMEEFYETKIKQLYESNRIFEEQLEEAEEKITQLEALQVNSNNYSTSNLSKQKQTDSEEKYQKQLEINSELEKKITALNRFATRLENELEAYESAQQTNTIQLSPSQLKTKVAYLTTRLSQERSKQYDNDEKIEQLAMTVKELQMRNRDLERKLRY